MRVTGVSLTNRCGSPFNRLNLDEPTLTKGSRDHVHVIYRGQFHVRSASRAPVIFRVPERPRIIPKHEIEISLTSRLSSPADASKRFYHETQSRPSIRNDFVDVPNDPRDGLLHVRRGKGSAPRIHAFFRESRRTVEKRRVDVFPGVSVHEGLGICCEEWTFLVRKRRRCRLKKL
jgi:hypothetical protein